MRTSRVNATTSSVFRQENQYLHAGDISHNFGQNPQNLFKNSLQRNKEKKRSSIIAPNQQQQHQHTVPIHMDSTNDLQIRHELNETALKLSHLSRQKKRLNSYRSSI
ncbi:NAD synthetase [Lysinibacillus fusiformis]|uniref:NAD synthetase n=1 Tax=Lysinibacillus fusiformis TaxID=28031 RepID=UPI00148B59D6|nr:NAD synthetase [Lysinibacillus fusiformis]NOG30292.1 NAD synthetase [Lysinibacillus fusiformis]